MELFIILASRSKFQKLSEIRAKRKFLELRGIFVEWNQQMLESRHHSLVFGKGNRESQRKHLLKERATVRSMSALSLS